jgi:Zn-dependent protease
MPVVIAMLTAMLVGLPAMMLHECGHIAAARICGVKVKKVGISWIGLYVVRESGPKWANLLISFSGPFVNLLLASALWSTMPGFAQANLFIGIGSLIPLPKSDGKRILTLLRSSGEAASWNNSGRILSGSQAHTGVEVGSGRLTLT